MFDLVAGYLCILLCLCGYLAICVILLLILLLLLLIGLVVLVLLLGDAWWFYCIGRCG